MLTLDHLGRRFPNGTQALQGASLRIGQGDFVALLGPSGCGKSTLLRLIAGLDAPDAGRLAWDGGAAPAPGEIGFVFQDATLLPWADAADNVFLPLRLRGRDRRRPKPKSRRRWRGSVWSGSRMPARANYPAACACAFPSPAPWSPARACC